MLGRTGPGNIVAISIRTVSSPWNNEEMLMYFIKKAQEHTSGAVPS